MRGLFIALLIANLGYAGWLYHRHSQPEHRNKRVSQQVVHSDIAPVLLLSEHDNAKQDVPEKSVASKQVLATVDRASTENESISDKLPVAKDVVASSERRIIDACYTLGPFRKLDKLRTVIRALKDDVQEASFRSNEEREQSIFWVYLKSEADLLSAKNTTKMLRQQKIKDSYIIAEGANKFGISLGHFREKPRAYSLRDKIASLGFSPVVEPIFKNYTIYWLDFRIKSGKGADNVLSNIKLDKNISRFDRDCG